MIYNIWGLVFFVCFLLFFCFLFSSFTESGKRVGKRAEERESKQKEETPGTFSQVKIIPSELFLTLFFIFFFPLLDVKITTTKKFFQENRTHNIYTTSIWQLPLCICKKCRLLSTCTNFNTWSFYFLSSDSCIENSWRTKVDFRRGLSYLIFLHFFFSLKELTYFQPKRKRSVFTFIYIYLYM